MCQCPDFNNSYKKKLCIKWLAYGQSVDKLAKRTTCVDYPRARAGRA